MDLEQGLFSRRSVRKYIKNRSIPTRTLHEILSAAMHAPSARNAQCWEFIVVENKHILAKISDIHACCASYIKDVSAAIIVCGNTKTQASNNCWIVDAANASMQILLASYAKGLGSCWCGIFPDKERMHKFGILMELPPHIECLSMIALGYPQEEPQQPKNRYDIKKIHMNRW